MSVVISDDMVLNQAPPFPVLCFDVYMIKEIELDVFWQRCDD